MEDDPVEGPAAAAFADDYRRCAQHRRNGRVRQADDGADAGVAGALDQEHVEVVAERIARGDDPGPEVFDDLPGDVLLREPARDVDPTHRSVVGGEWGDL